MLRFATLCRKIMMIHFQNASFCGFLRTENADFLGICVCVMGGGVFYETICFYDYITPWVVSVASLNTCHARLTLLSLNTGIVIIINLIRVGVMYLDTCCYIHVCMCLSVAYHKFIQV